MIDFITAKRLWDITCQIDEISCLETQVSSTMHIILENMGESLTDKEYMVHCFDSLLLAHDGLKRAIQELDRQNSYLGHIAAIAKNGYTQERERERERERVLEWRCQLL